MSENYFSFDMMKMYFGDDFVFNKYITFYQPTIGEILDFGEDNLQKAIAPLVGNTTSYRLQLWDSGVDWNTITDWELFVLLYKTMTPDITCIVFGRFDFTNLIAVKRVDTESVVLGFPKFDDEGNVIDFETVIDEVVYYRLCEYVRTIFNQHPKVQKAKGRAKEVLIKRDREELQKRKDSGVGSSFLLPLISGLVNHPGFKYKKNELREVGYIEFMDSVQRLLVYEQSTAFLKGMYSGFMDTSKIPKKELEQHVNWLRDLYKKDS